MEISKIMVAKFENFSKYHNFAFFQVVKMSFLFSKSTPCSTPK